MNKKRALIEIEEIGTYGIAETILGYSEDSFLASASRSGIIAKMTGTGEWQPAHRHIMKQEEYFVFSGVLVFASGNHDAISLQVYHVGESFMCEPGIVHTVYTPEDTLFGVISSGGDDTDFYPEPSMDKEIQFIDMRGLILDKFV